MAGLLLTPMLGCTARTSLDWCHAWAIIGQWSNFMAFPLPEKTTADQQAYLWPRHGHTGQLTAKMRTRIPSLTGWARPAFEQGALPPLCLLPARCPIYVLPGDKMFQADTLIEGFANPVIFHGYSGNKDKWGQKLEKRASGGLPTMLECLLGTTQLPPLWQHESGCNFAVGARWTAKNVQGCLTLSQKEAIRQTFAASS